MAYKTSHFFMRHVYFYVIYILSKIKKVKISDIKCTLKINVYFFLENENKCIL